MEPLGDAEIEQIIARHFADGHEHVDGRCPWPVYQTNELLGLRGVVVPEVGCPECGQPQLELWSGVCCSRCRWSSCR